MPDDHSYRLSDGIRLLGSCNRRLLKGIRLSKNSSSPEKILRLWLPILTMPPLIALICDIIMCFISLYSCRPFWSNGKGWTKLLWTGCINSHSSLNMLCLWLLILTMPPLMALPNAICEIIYAFICALFLSAPVLPFRAKSRDEQNYSGQVAETIPLTFEPISPWQVSVLSDK